MMSGTSEHSLWDVVVVGGGPGGMSAALWAHRLDLRVVLLEASPQLGGQLSTLFSPVVDYPGLPVSHGYELVPHFVSHLEQQQVPVLLKARVVRILPAEQDGLPHGLELESGERVWARGVILALGACRRRLGVPGEAELAGRGVTFSSTRDKKMAVGRRVVVVGGGDAALEGALILSEGAMHVTVVHRGAQWRGRARFVEEAQARPNITLVTDARVVRIEGNLEGPGARLSEKCGDPGLEQTVPQVQAVVLEGEANGLTEGEGARREAPGRWRLATEAVYVRVGVMPCSELVSSLLPLDVGGYVLVGSDQQTEVAGIYAIGDLCSALYSSVANAMGQGMVAAKALQMRLKGP